jgi:hypothetical protein
MFPSDVDRGRLFARFAKSIRSRLVSSRRCLIHVWTQALTRRLINQNEMGKPRGGRAPRSGPRTMFEFALEMVILDRNVRQEDLHRA